MLDAGAGGAPADDRAGVDVVAVSDSSGKYEDQILTTGSFTGTPEQALDCACTLYLSGPTG